MLKPFRSVFTAEADRYTAGKLFTGLLAISSLLAFLRDLTLTVLRPGSESWIRIAWLGTSFLLWTALFALVESRRELDRRSANPPA